MHYHTEIIIPPTRNVPAAVAKIMSPFKEAEDSSHGFWDFYIIGGRWSGEHTTAKFAPELVREFWNECERMKVKVSSFTAGRQELASEFVLPVNTLWKRLFPDAGEDCLFFNHARDQYAKDGSPDDVIAVADVPRFLTCSRLIVSGGDGEAKRMLTVDIWNGVEHQPTSFDGKVPAAISAIRNAEDKWNRVDIGDDWLCVTVDYHS